MKRKLLVVVVLLCAVLIVPAAAMAANSVEIADWSYYVDDWYSSSDNEDVQAALDAVKWAVNTGVMNGKPDNVLDPQGAMARAEVAQLMMVYSGLYMSEF